MGLPYNTIYENILSAIQSITPKVLEVQKIINGLYADLYEPLTDTSIYCDDKKFHYNTIPTQENVKVLITGIHQETFGTFFDYDNFLNEGAIIWTLEPDIIQRYWKVIVKLGNNRRFHFKVDHHIYVAGVEEPVIVKNILIPF